MGPIQTVDFDEAFGATPVAGPLRLGASRAVEEIRDLAGRLPLPAQLLGIVSLGVLLLSVAAVWLAALLGSPFLPGRSQTLMSGALAVLIAMILLYLLARRSDKKVAARALAERIDRKARV